MDHLTLPIALLMVGSACCLMRVAALDYRLARQLTIQHVMQYGKPVARTVCLRAFITFVAALGLCAGGWYLMLS
jgi:hypothetical protein